MVTVYLRYELPIITNYFADNLQSDVYDTKDVERMASDDGLLRSFLRHQKSSVEKAAIMMDTSFKWRKDMKLGCKYTFNIPLCFAFNCKTKNKGNNYLYTVYHCIFILQLVLNV